MPKVRKGTDCVGFCVSLIVTEQFWRRLCEASVKLAGFQGILCEPWNPWRNHRRTRFCVSSTQWTLFETCEGPTVP